MGEASLDIEAPTQLPPSRFRHPDGAPSFGPLDPIELEEALRERDAELARRVRTLGGFFALGLYLQEAEGLSTLEAGLALVPLALPLAALTSFTGRLVGRVGPRLPAGVGLALSGVGHLGTALVGSTNIDSPIGWAFLTIAGAGMGVEVPGLVAGGTEALGPDRAGIASAVNNTSRQVGGAIGVALIGGLASISTSLIFSGSAFLLGGVIALTLMGTRRGEKPSVCDGKSPRPWRETRSMTD
jgi:MFS family permease